MAKSTVSIVVNVKGNNAGFKQLSRDAEAMKRAVQTAVNDANRSVQSLTFAGVSQAIGNAQSAIAEFRGVVSDLVSAYNVQLEAETKLQTVMTQRMGATAADIEAIKQLCSAQQQLGIIGDEIQLQGAQQIATFLKERQSLEALIPAMNNLLAQQKGVNATGQDAVAIGNLIGKVMTGQTAALKRVGITFDSAQEKVLKYGTETEKAAMLAKVVEQNVGQMNAELAKTGFGKAKQLANHLGDIKEQLGAVAAKIAPMLRLTASITTTAMGVAKLYTAMRSLAAAVNITNLRLRVLPMLLQLSGMSATKSAQAMRLLGSGAQFAGRAALALKVALRSLMSATLVGAAIAALGYVIDKFVFSCNDGKEAAEGLSDALEEQGGVARELSQQAAELAIKEQERLDTLYHTAIDETKSRKKRLEALAEMQGRWPSYFNGLSIENSSIQSLSQAYKRLAKDIEAAAEARAAFELITQKKKNILSRELEIKHLREKNGDLHQKEAKLQNTPGKTPASTPTPPKKQNSPQYTPLGSYNTQGADSRERNPNAWQQPLPSPVNAQNAKALTELRSEITANAQRSRELAAQNKQDQEDIAYLLKIANNGSDPKVLNTNYTPSAGRGGGGLRARSGSVGTPKPTIKPDSNDKDQLETNLRLGREEYIKQGTTDARKEELEKYFELWQGKLDEIKAVEAQLGRPQELVSLSDYNKELEYLRTMRDLVPVDKAAEYNDQIKAVEASMKAVQSATAAEWIPVGEIDNIETLNGQLQLANELMQTGDSESRRLAAQRIRNLERLKNLWDQALEDLDKPVGVEALNTLEDLQQAVQYYGEIAKRQSGDELFATQKLIRAYQDKAQAIERAAELLDMRREVDTLNGYDKKRRRAEASKIGQEGYSDRIERLQDMLNDTNNPVTGKQREEIESLIATYQQLRRESFDTFGAVRSGWESLRGLYGVAESIDQAFRQSGNTMQKVITIIEALFSTLEAIQSIIGLIKTLSTVFAASSAAAAAASVPQIAANKMEAASWTQLAAARLFAANASIPIVGFAAAAGQVAAMEALVASAGVVALAKGGVAYGPTLSLIGEYSGARSNPEVVAPLDKLKALIGNGGGGNEITGELVLRGDNLVATLTRRLRKLQRT